MLRQILAGFGEQGTDLEASQIRAAPFGAKADEYSELRERLNSLTNDDPRVQALRHEAAALIDAGEFDPADAKLSEKAERIDLAAVEELEEVAAHHRARAATSRAERGAAARLRLDYRGAVSAHFAAAAFIVERDNAAAWGYRCMQAAALYDRGSEFGDNAALHEAIAVYGEALRRAPRELDWARTQNNLGNALRTLGERESGTARLEEAVAAYRAALKERTRDRVPLNGR